MREQPHHVRRRVAFGAAGALTALIAVVWLGASLATGTFALKGSNFAEVTGAESAATASESSTSESFPNSGGVAGAAAAETSRSAPAHIEIVPTDTPTKTPAGPTIIPF